jgi:uncharacterized membrane protein YraQ (UPF0718 family)
VIAIRLQEWITRFTAIVVTAFPLMILGLLVYALVEHIAPRDKIIARLPHQKWLAVPVAALLGIVLPVCDCGVVPTARALVRRELGLAPALAFIIGAPVVNPIVLVTTAIGFGFNYTIAIARLLMTYVVAVSVGLLAVVAFGETPLDELVLPPSSFFIPEKEVGRKATGARSALRVMRKNGGRVRAAPVAALALPAPLQTAAVIVATAGDELLDLGRFLILGAAIASAVQTFVPQAPLLAVSQNVILSTLALMALASILSVCSISDAPVAASFLGLFAPGAIFGFMLFGQIFDLKNAAMLLATFRRTVVIFLVVSSALLVLALGTLVNLGVL